ncbi:MAG: hypothetical protein EKK41_26835 [Hyphomicrobiales bacterium]|nr:MAG: hypothetical protein EKK41_26835 [Hyphomicrobiales bacterium]
MRIAIRALLALFVVGGLGIIIQFLAELEPSTSHLSKATASSVITGSVSPAKGIRNHAHELLMQKPEAERPLYLGAVVNSGCRGKRAFFMGLGTDGFAAGEAFWSVECRDGRTFSVMISPDSLGTTRSMPCELLAALKAGKCFSVLKGAKL